MEEDSIKEITKDSDTLFVSFGGRLKMFGKILPFEFLNFFGKTLSKFQQIICD